MNNNRLRLYALSEILKKYSDENHALSIDELKNYLENEYQIVNVYRKTLYADLHFLESIGLDINYQHKKGYFLNGQLFSLAEIKILNDALDDIKNLDEHFLMNMQNKLNTFLSINQQDIIKRLTFLKKHEKTYFLYHLDTLLLAYQHQHTILLTYKTKQEEVEIVSFDLSNGQYYLLYTYPRKKKIYRLNFRNITSIKETNNRQTNFFTKDFINKYLKESYRGFHNEDNLVLHLKIISANSQIKSWLTNDFPGIEFFKDEALLKTSNSPLLMANLLAYQKDVKIIGPKEFKEEYLAYLKEAILSLTY